MDEKIDQAIAILAGKIVQSVKPDDAMRYSQAALDLARVKEILTTVAKDRSKTKGAGSLVEMPKGKKP